MSGLGGTQASQGNFQFGKKRETQRETTDTDSVNFTILKFLLFLFFFGQCLITLRRPLTPDCPLEKEDHRLTLQAQLCANLQRTLSPQRGQP